jgi:hypothetical protein
MRVNQVVSVLAAATLLPSRPVDWFPDEVDALKALAVEIG